jgi:hypothetical protein
MADLRFAIRQLLKSPGVHASCRPDSCAWDRDETAIFSLINDRLKRLPFAEPERIVSSQAEAKVRNLQALPTSVTRFWHYRDGHTGFTLTGLGDTVQLNGSTVTGNYYLDLLGIRPILGCLFRL